MRNLFAFIFLFCIVKIFVIVILVTQIQNTFLVLTF